MRIKGSRQNRLKFLDAAVSRPHEVRARYGLAAFLTLAALGTPAHAGRAEAKVPEPAGLLREVLLGGPKTSYRGRMMVTRRFGRQAQVEELAIMFSPPNRYRREFLGPDGRVERIVVGDGRREQVYLPGTQALRKGAAAKPPLPRPGDGTGGEGKGLDLLLKNYRLSVSGPGKAAGRSVWALNLDPLVKGKPQQRLLVDQRTRVILENRRLIPGGRFAAVDRFIEFEPRKTLPQSLFRLDVDSAARVEAPGPMDPADSVSPFSLLSLPLSLEELNRKTGGSPSFPGELPAGFIFDGARAFRVGKNSVRHLGYTDGLTALSLFVTDRRVRLPREPAFPSRDVFPGELRLSSAGQVLYWNSGGTHYTLIGDLSRELLEQIAVYLDPSAKFTGRRRSRR